MGFVASAAEIDDVAVGERDAQAEDVVAGGPVEEREGAGGVAGDHAADGGGGFGGIGREVETGRDGGADGGEGRAGLDAQLAVFGGEDPAHVGEIEDEAAFGDGPAGHAGAGALGRDGQLLFAGFGEGGEHLGLGAGERDAVGAADAPGLVAQVVGVGGLERFTHAGQYSLPRLPAHG